MRPKSACSVRPRQASRSPRPRSALGLRHHENAEWSEVAVVDRDKDSKRRQAPVQQYHRCLRLLGLGGTSDEPKDIGKKPNLKRVEARVQTFLGRRTVSHDDVRDAVLKEMDRSLSGCDAAHDNAVVRRLLAKAVYEEWYLNKLDTARERRKQECLQKKTAQWQQVRVKRERYEKSQEKFTEWIKNKNEKMKKEQQLQNKSGRDENRSDVTGHVPYNMWKEEKDKVLKRYINEENRRKRRQEEEKKKQEERRAEAEKAFETWKRSADENLKTKLQERERRRKEEKDKASTETEEKQRNADAAFTCWKRKKDVELKRRIKEQREKEEAAATMRKSLLVDRRQSSQQAFLDWLDSHW